VQQPPTLKRTALFRADCHWTIFRHQKVQQRRNWHKPSVLSAQAFHETSKPGIQRAVLDKTIREVRVHDARASLGFQTILIRSKAQQRPAVF
jgi:hypothetical protein